MNRRGRRGQGPPPGTRVSPGRIPQAQPIINIPLRQGSNDLQEDSEESSSDESDQGQGSQTIQAQRIRP